MRYEMTIGQGFDRWNSGEYTPGQIEAFHDFENSFILLSGAYRSGKSEIGARAAIRHAIFFPGAKVAVIRQYISSLRKSTLRTVLELIHPSWVKSWSNTFLEMELINGSRISFIAAESPDKLGSIELTFAFIDEASEVSEESLGMISGRLSGALQLPPNFDELPDNIQAYLLGTLEKRQVYLACNPKGKSHYLYKRFIEEPKPGHVCYTSNSVSNNNLPEVYLVNNLSAYAVQGVTAEWITEQIRAIRSGEKSTDGMHLKPFLTEFGQRNLLSLWVALEGRIYNISEDFLVDEAPEFWGEPTGNYYASMDYGFKNGRVMLYEEYLYRGQEHYLVIDYWAKKDCLDSEFVEKIHDWDLQYTLTKAWVPHDAGSVRKKLIYEIGGSHVSMAKNSVEAGISTTSRFINGRRILFKRWADDRHVLFFNECQDYQWATDRKTGEALDKPLKEKDHAPDTLRYFIYSKHKNDKLSLEKPNPVEHLGLKVDEFGTIILPDGGNYYAA